MIGMTPEQYAERKKTTPPKPVKLCCRCKRNPAKPYRCAECTAEAQRISKIATGKRDQTMIGE